MSGLWAQEGEKEEWKEEKETHRETEMRRRGTELCFIFCIVFNFCLIIFIYIQSYNQYVHFQNGIKL